MFYYYKMVFQNHFAFFDYGTLLVHLPVTAARLFFPCFVTSTLPPGCACHRAERSPTRSVATSAGSITTCPPSRQNNTYSKVRSFFILGFILIFKIVLNSCFYYMYKDSRECCPSSSLTLNLKKSYKAKMSTSVFFVMHVGLNLKEET